MVHIHLVSGRGDNSWVGVRGQEFVLVVLEDDVTRGMVGDRVSVVGGLVLVQEGQRLMLEFVGLVRLLFRIQSWKVIRVNLIKSRWGWNWIVVGEGGWS